MRKLVLLLTLVGLSFTVVPPVLAYTQGSCSGSDPSVFHAYENIIGDQQDFDDDRWYCSSSTVMGLHPIPSFCAGAVLFNDTWDECVSSFSVSVPSGQRFCAYRNSSYGGTVFINRTSGIGRTNLTGSANDAISSFRWISSSSSC